MITVIGWPRSGTHWLKALLEAALETEVIHSHPIPKELIKGNRYIFTTRDPRDSFISHYEVHLATVDGDISQEDFLHGYFMGAKQTQAHFKLGWRRYHELWLERTHGPTPWRSVAVTSHEVLKRDPTTTLGQILFYLGYSVHTYRPDMAVMACSGVRWDPSPLPVYPDMGTVGRWRTTMERGLAESLWEYCGDVAERLGYKWEEQCL